MDELQIRRKALQLFDGSVGLTMQSTHVPSSVDSWRKISQAKRWGRTKHSKDPYI